VATRLPSLLCPPIGFAHRGARAHAPENTIESFLLARRLGATGLESDVWITADGVAVLDHDGVVGRRPRRRPIARFARADLPGHIPTLEQLYTECGTAFDLSLDVKDAAAIDAVLEVARRFNALDRLWLCHHELGVLAGWRSLDPTVRLVDSSRLAAIKEGPERRAARLAELGIDALNMRMPDWSGGLTTLVHRFGVLALGWDAQHERELDALLDMGIDGVYCDHVDRMTAALARITD
jgi:glycerophosphoryl diester phosphodiesterase